MSATNKEFYVKDRLFRRNMPSGQVFKKPSLTIQGQEISPAEMVRQFVVKAADGSRNNSIFFNEINFHQYLKMDEMDRRDYLARIKEQVQQNRDLVEKYRNDYREQLKMLEHEEQELKKQEQQKKAASKDKTE